MQISIRIKLIEMTFTEDAVIYGLIRDLWAKIADHVHMIQGQRFEK